MTITAEMRKQITAKLISRGYVGSTVKITRKSAYDHPGSVYARKEGARCISFVNSASRILAEPS